MGRPGSVRPVTAPFSAIQHPHVTWMVSLGPSRDVGSRRCGSRGGCGPQKVDVGCITSRWFSWLMVNFCKFAKSLGLFGTVFRTFAWNSFEGLIFC